MTAQEELVELAKFKMKDDQCSFSEALRRVYRARPALASEARAEVMKSQTVFDPEPGKEELTPGPAAAEMTRLAREKVNCTSLSFGEALLSVAREHPLLASGYRREVTKSEG